MTMTKIAAFIVGGLLLFGGGYLLGSRPDPKAIAKVHQLEQRADSLDHVAAHRDTVQLTKLVTARAHTDTLLATDTTIRSDTVRLVLAGERAACDTVIAAKDSTIAEARGLRNDAIQEAGHPASRGATRFTLAAVVVIPDARPAIVASYRVTRILGFDVNLGVAYRL